MILVDLPPGTTLFRGNKGSDPFMFQRVAVGVSVASELAPTAICWADGGVAVGLKPDLHRSRSDFSPTTTSPVRVPGLSG